MNCLLCGSNNTKFKFIFTGEDIYLTKLDIEDFNLRWYECKECGVYFSKQYKNIEDIYDDSLLYDASYDEQQIKSRFDSIMNLDASVSDNIQRVKRCKEYHKKYLDIFSVHKEKYDVLDIGAGLGVFLAEYLDEEYNGHALELNKIASQHIKNVLPIVKTYQDFMQNINFKSKFDLITLNRVLEHISEPVDVLTSVVKAMCTTGIVYLELPDTLSYRLSGDFNEAFSSGHYMVYNPESIYYLFKKVGLTLYRLERVKEPSGKYTIYAFGGVI